MLISSLHVESGVSKGVLGVIRCVFTGTGPLGWGRDFLDTLSELGGFGDSDLKFQNKIVLDNDIAKI